MKYMISWFERPQGSPTEYENAQKRILEVFSQWKAPDNFKIELFVVRVGEWGGHMLVDCDDPVAVHKACSTFPAFEFQARPVIAVEDAVRGRTRSYCLARWTETQVTSERITSHSPRVNQRHYPPVGGGQRVRTSARPRASPSLNRT